MLENKEEETKKETKFEGDLVTSDASFEERVLKIRRVSAKRSGGSSVHFSALSAAGDHSGKIGVAVAKSKENINAIKKSKEKAKRSMFEVCITEEGSIPHEVKAKKGAAILYMRPAPLGSGIIAGGCVRQILELAGYKNVSAKVIGSSNQINNAYVTVVALKKIKHISEKLANLKSDDIGGSNH